MICEECGCNTTKVISTVNTARPWSHHLDYLANWGKKTDALKQHPKAILRRRKCTECGAVARTVEYSVVTERGKRGRQSWEGVRFRQAEVRRYKSHWDGKKPPENLADTTRSAPEPEETVNPKDFLIIASVSGGKDSAAMALWLKERGYDYRCVFADTGWEDEQTYHYLREVLPKYIGPIDWVRKEIPLEGKVERVALEFEERLGHYSPMVRAALKKAMFPSRVTRWCTREMKIEPIKEYVLGLEDAIVQAVGIRAAESASRSKMPEWEWSDSFRCDVWRPLLRWSVRDVINIHKRHGLPANPLYSEETTRVGCWPCIYSRKSAIRAWAKDDKRVAILRDLEAAVTELARERATRKGETLVRSPSWFQSPGGSYPLDEAITWATSNLDNYEGRREELFLVPESENGCVRWGMCDTDKPTDKKGDSDEVS